MKALITISWGVNFQTEDEVIEMARRMERSVETAMLAARGDVELTPVQEDLLDDMLDYYGSTVTFRRPLFSEERS